MDDRQKNMNVLFVDDQKTVVNFLKQQIDWDKLPVKQVYTATGAKEAKLIMMNFAVDLLVTDIEMPQEDGLSLAAWAREQDPDMVIVLLTSYANFAYAQKAISLGIHSYILQPVKISAIEEMILQVSKEISARKSRKKEVQNFNPGMWDALFDSMIVKCREKQAKDAEEYLNKILAGQGYGSDHGRCYLGLLRFRENITWGKKWEDTRIRFIFRNVLTELFAEDPCTVLVSNIRAGDYWILLLFETDKRREEEIRENFSCFRNFLTEHTGTDFSAFYKGSPIKDGINEETDALMYYSERKKMSQCGIYQVDLLEYMHSDGNDNCIGQAIAYIQEHLEDNPGRTEVAEYVHMNQDYFSRVFREHTGLTFKEYLLQEKMEKAKKLLKNTQLSVGIIGMKLGYDNFSHFTSSFKKYTGITPKEYREQNR